MIKLSNRQRDVLVHVAGGATDKEIAKLFGIEVASVKQHILLARIKLGAKNRTAAAVSAVRAGLV